MRYLLLLLLAPLIASAGRLQNVDFMTEAELVLAGATASSLLNDDKIYVTSIAKTLDDAIADGDIAPSITSKGDLLGNNGAGTANCVLDKTDGYLLTVDAAASCGFDMKPAPVSVPTTTKGDLSTHDGTNPTRLPVGADGTFLVADSNEADGIKWSDTISGSVLQANEFAKVVIPPTFNSGCSWYDRVSTLSQTPQSDPDCGDAAVGGEVTGSITMPDTKVPSFTLNNVVAGNVYEITTSHIIYKTSTSANVSCETALVVGGSGYPAGNLFRGTNGTDVSNKRNTHVHNYTATTSGDVTLVFQIRESVLNTCQVDTRLQNWSMSVKEFPAKASTVAYGSAEMINLKYRKITASTYAQNTPLANRDVVYDSLVYDNSGGMYSTSTGAFTNTSSEAKKFKVCAGILMTNSSWGAGTASSLAIVHTNATYGNTILQRNTTANVTSNRFDNHSSCDDIKMDSGDSIKIHYFHNTAATQTVYTAADDYSYFSISEIKDKAIITGVFENINSSDLDQVSAQIGTYTTTTNTAIPIFSSPTHETNNFSPTSTTFVPSASGFYNFAGFFRSSSSFAGTFYLYKNNSIDTILAQTGAATNYVGVSYQHYLTAGDTYDIRMNTAELFERVAMSISALPDTESIIKNLYADNAVKCQTKYLSAAIIADTVGITDLQFTGLDVGKTYEVTSGAHIGGTGGSLDNIILDSYHNGIRVCRAVEAKTGINEASKGTIICEAFTATTTTLTHDVFSISSGNFLRGTSDNDGTWVKLCELPSTYTTTTEW